MYIVAPGVVLAPSKLMILVTRQAASERASQAAKATKASLVKDPENIIRSGLSLDDTPSQRRVRTERLFMDTAPHSVRTEVTP